MTDRHSFNSYVRNSWIFVTLVNNVHSFNSYVRNTHSFELIVDGYEVIASWFLGIHNHVVMAVTAVLQQLNLTLAFTIRATAMGFTAALIQMTQSWLLPVTIAAPIIAVVMRMVQSMGTVDIVLPNGISLTMKDAFYLGDTAVVIPPVVVNPVIACQTFYMLNRYDPDLLSVWDATLLSTMDSVAT